MISQVKSQTLERTGIPRLAGIALFFLMLTFGYFSARGQSQDTAMAVEALKSRSIPVEYISIEGSSLVVRLNYTAGAEATPDRIKDDILEVFRQTAAVLGSAQNLKVEAIGEGILVFELKASSRDVLDFAAGRMAERDFLIRVDRSDRITMSEILKDAIAKAGEQAQRQAEAQAEERRNVEESQGIETSEGGVSAGGEPVFARLMSFAVAAFFVLIATVLIVRMAVRRKISQPADSADATSTAAGSESRTSRLQRPWYSVLLPSIFALGSVGLIIFAFSVWSDDGFFDPDLETLSAWLCALGALAAASVAIVLFRRVRSGATHLLAALFFFIVFSVLFWLLIYIGDQVFVSTSDLFFRGDIYEKGTYGQKDEAEASKWFRKAASRGNVEAMERLAVLYEEGRGVPGRSGSG